MLFVGGVLFLIPVSIALPDQQPLHLRQADCNLEGQC